MVIAHATDLSGDDAAAFLHAAALSRGARLITLYAGSDRAAAAPDAAALALRWRRRIDYEFRRIECCDDVAETLIEALRALKPDLVVVGTHARHGLAALLHGSVGEAIARNLDVPVLVVPNTGRGFVDPELGTIDVRRIVIPSARAVEAKRGLAAARRLLPASEHAVMELVHVGPLDPELAQLGVPLTQLDGELEHAIVDAVHARTACMIVMPTRSHDGIGDVVRGSHTERVIRDASCPVLSVPM